MDETYSKTFETKTRVIIIVFICDILTISTVVPARVVWIRSEEKLIFLQKCTIKTRTECNAHANNIFI